MKLILCAHTCFHNLMNFHCPFSLLADQARIVLIKKTDKMIQNITLKFVFLNFSYLWPEKEKDECCLEFHQLFNAIFFVNFEPKLNQ